MTISEEDIYEELLEQDRLNALIETLNTNAKLIPNSAIIALLGSINLGNMLNDLKDTNPKLFFKLERTMEELVEWKK